MCSHSLHMTDTDYSPLVTHFSYFIEELVALKNIINVHRFSYYRRATGMEISPELWCQLPITMATGCEERKPHVHVHTQMNTHTHTHTHTHTAHMYKYTSTSKHNTPEHTYVTCLTSFTCHTSTWSKHRWTRLTGIISCYHVIISLWLLGHLVGLG